MKGYDKIKNYAVIGNGRSAALVSKGGSIDWLCWPRFDSPSLFGALLDKQKGGYWSITPTGHFSVQRKYLKNSMVLHTTFSCESGTAVLFDCMPIQGEKTSYLIPEQQIIRIVECVNGTVPFQITLKPSPMYGKVSVKCVRSAFGNQYSWKGRAVLLRSEIEIDENGSGYFKLTSGQSFSMSLAFIKDTPGIIHPLGAFLKTVVNETIREWDIWAQKCTYNGAYRSQVLRSALFLKSVIYSPSGAIIAAPTTSLPERLHGELNWDYRFCWLRDASLTVRALFDIGFYQEAEAFASWLLHTTRLTRPKLRVFYDVYGGLSGKEKNADWLDGYAGSKPVRFGNNARNQFQLDIYGEVIDAVGHIIEIDKKKDSETERMLINFGQFICKHWAEADEGIWEPRSGPAQHTHSKVNCWAGLNRLIDLQSKNLITNKHNDIFYKTRQMIKKTVMHQGWDEIISSYVQKLNSSILDMGSLLMALHGFEDPSSDRMVKTYRALKNQLYAGHGLFFRNNQSKIVGEGTFGICSFWAAEYLARGGGSLEEASQQFEILLSHANDVGLYAEEIEPESFDFLGNFPQAFTHIGLINAAISIEERRLRGT